jgi:hypothetical protein
MYLGKKYFDGASGALSFLSNTSAFNFLYFFDFEVLPLSFIGNADFYFAK